MSRSYRKPYWTQGYGGRWRKAAKRMAAKKVRKEKLVADDSFYKRLYNSWDICDFKFFEYQNDKKLWKVKRK